jgi:hypothetical protein
MPDTSPATPERTVVVPARPSRLVTILTIVNSVVLALIILGAIIHHHRMKHEQEQGFAGRDRDGGGRFERGGPGDFEKFHHPRHFGFDGGPGGGRDGGFGGPGAGMGHQRGMGMRGDMGMPRGGGGMGMMGRNANPDQMTDALLQHLGTQLGLTDDQKAKIKPLVQADVTEMQKNAQAFRESMQKEMEDAKAKLRPLLNADQQKQLDAMPMPGPKAAGGDQDSPPAK